MQRTLNAENPGSDSSMQSFVSMSSNEPIQLESETSADELALDIKSQDYGWDSKNPQPKTSSDRYFKKNKGSRMNRRPNEQKAWHGFLRLTSHVEIISWSQILCDKWSLRHFLICNCHLSRRSLKCFHFLFEVLYPT